MTELPTKTVADLMNGLLQEQINFQKSGNYVRAEQCRLKIEHERNNRDKKNLQQLNLEHQKLRDNLTQNHYDQMKQFHSYWDSKMEEFGKKAQQMIDDLSTKHKNDLKSTSDKLGKQLSIKIKESTDLLNLRKMEQYLVKQKNYTQAKKVQDEAKKLYDTQAYSWNQRRNAKIEATLNTLKLKQNNEMKNLQQRISNKKSQHNSDRNFAQLQMKQKYQNNMKDLKKAQEKEVLGFKGELRNLGGTFTNSFSPSKAKMEKKKPQK